MAKKNIVKKEIISRNNFSYEKNGAKLDFSLRIDRSDELRNFKDCMLQAVEDIDVILKGLKN